MSRYAPLFVVTATHEFSGDGPCRALTLAPTGATRAMAERAGLVVRQRPGEISVLFDRDRLSVLREIAADAAEPFSLVIEVRSTDPLLAAYTDPSPFREGSVLYLRSDGEGGEVLDGTRAVSDVDFHALDGGDALPEELRALAALQDRVLAPVAVVALGPDVVPMEDEGSEDGLAFVLGFHARSTVWRYYLLGGLAELDARVVDPDGGAEFEVGREVLPGGRSAVTFTSREPIPLSARSDRRFQLRENGAGRERVLIGRLPVASAESVRVESVAGERLIVSEIFVNG